jgi:pilus assembly protein CpaB
VVNAVTLEVTPDQAERLDLARSVGNLSLVLRNQVDENQAGTGGVRKAELLGEVPAPVAAVPVPAAAPAPRPRLVRRPPPPPKPEPDRVEVIRGVQRSQTEL